MIKRDELMNPNSCLNRALADERLFVLRASDVVAPAVIRAWVDARLAAGENVVGDPQIDEAIACAESMESERPELVRRKELDMTRAKLEELRSFLLDRPRNERSGLSHAFIASAATIANDALDALNRATQPR